MKKEHLKRIFDFLEDKEEHKVPFIFKVKCEIPFTEKELNVKGCLDLRFTKVTSLPKRLYVDGDLNICETPLQKYTDEELRDMIKPRFIKRKIKRG